MSIFWPNDLDIDDSDDPIFIIQEARVDWEKESKGSLTIDVKQRESNDGYVIISLTARHVTSSRTAELCSVFHRHEFPYPAKIQTNDRDLPDKLKKKYYKPGVPDMFSSLSSVGQGRTIENDYVADSPSEFRALLVRALNLGTVKAAILSIVGSRKVIGPNEEH